jgi:predicted kinase
MKELFLLRGLPGAGKSTLANSIEAYHVEADMFFVHGVTNEYKFDASKLGKAHEWCQSVVDVCMSDKLRKIAVSNTFTMEWEMQPYFDLAEKYGYRVYSLVVENRHGESENTNIHKVPKEKIDSMRERFQIKL